MSAALPASYEPGMAFATLLDNRKYTFPAASQRQSQLASFQSHSIIIVATVAMTRPQLLQPWLKLLPACPPPPSHAPLPVPSPPASLPAPPHCQPPCLALCLRLYVSGSMSPPLRLLPCVSFPASSPFVSLNSYSVEIKLMYTDYETWSDIYAYLTYTLLKAIASPPAPVQRL